MGSARCTMWCMMGVPWFVLNMIRSGIPLLVTFIARRYALPDAQKAVLLGAFFPGYGPSPPGGGGGGGGVYMRSGRGFPQWFRLSICRFFYGRWGAEAA
jgi:hypothetical protein